MYQQQTSSSQLWRGGANLKNSGLKVKWLTAGSPVKRDSVVLRAKLFSGDKLNMKKIN